MYVSMYICEVGVHHYRREETIAKPAGRFPSTKAVRTLNLNPKPYILDPKPYILDPKP